MCCELLEVKSIPKKANVMCKHCDVSIGCKIHDTKPTECAEFECAYYQMEKVSVNLRPDNCKVIFEKISDTLFFGTLHYKYELTDIAKSQILSFNKEGFSVLIVTSGQTNLQAFISDNHTLSEIVQEYNNYIEKKSGGSSIHNKFNNNSTSKYCI